MSAFNTPPALSFLFKKKVVICAPGLIGASLALAIQKKWPEVQMILHARSQERILECQAIGIQAEGTTQFKDAAEQASFVILCMPVEHMEATVRGLIPYLSSECVVTDVGSVKGSVVNTLEPLLGGRFIGSHPMAGSEKSGAAHAKDNLLNGATCIVTPTLITFPAAIEGVQQFWQSLGMKTQLMSPALHDEIVSRISHLPHLMAALTVLTALQGCEQAKDCIANGFRDTTRVAMGDPQLWTQIVLHNQIELTQRLLEVQQNIAQLLQCLEKKDAQALCSFLEKSQYYKSITLS
jgi:prephenate dehydrogenase